MEDLRYILNEKNIRLIVWNNIGANIYPTPANHIIRNVRLNIGDNIVQNVIYPIKRNINPKAVRP